MAQVLFTVPKVVSGASLMALGLGTYWLFGNSRIRGWTLIAIFAVALVAFLYGVRLVWAWLDQRRERRVEISSGQSFEGRPWLKVPAWRRREIISGRTVGTPVLVLAYLFLGAPALLFLWVAVSPPTQSGLIERAGILSVAAMLAFVVGGLTYWRLRYWRYGNSVCRLLTLPGRVGGWLKADVECALPPGNDDRVTVRLKNVVPTGRSMTVVWQMEQHVAVPVQSGRTVVSVRLQIPRSIAQQVLSPDASAVARFTAPGWLLEIEKKVPGIDFLAQFGVPVYDVPEMPEEPPPQLQSAPLSEAVGRSVAAVVTLAGVATLVAISYQASRTGWLSTSIMSPSAEWMAGPRFQREMDVWSMSHYPEATQGRCAGGREEYRTNWQATPHGAHFWAWHGVSRRFFEQKHREYTAAGYRLEASTRFTDCSGRERLQRTWLKRKLAPQ